MPWAELHCHSNFSFLDGASSADDLVERARGVGLTGIAVTDHDGLYGAVRFMSAAEEVGVHGIIGLEVELLDAAVPDPERVVVPRRRRVRGERALPAAAAREGRPVRPRAERRRIPGHRDPVREDLRGIDAAQRGPHLVLLAADASGYRSLCRLVSAANLAGTKGVPRFTQALLAQHVGGLIALSGCRHGEVARRLLAGDREGAAAVVRRYGELFGGDFFLELQHHLLPDDDWLVHETATLAEETGAATVVTNDAHYARAEDRELQDVLVGIRHGLTLDESAHLRRPNGEYALKSEAEMLALPPGDRDADPVVRRAWLDGVRRAGEIAAHCQVEVEFEGYRFPGFPVPRGETAFSYLERLCHEGARRRYHPMTPGVLKQLAHELEVIERTGLAEFFLICWDLMRFSRERGIPAQGRGSAGDSIVAYALGITRVDPIRHRLLFERFINEGRTTYPDVDIDFATSRREEVIQYVYERYGPEHTGMVCNVVTYRARSAVREVGYALGFPRPLVDRVAKALETFDSVMVRRDLEADGGFAEFFAVPGEGSEPEGGAREVAGALAREAGFVDPMGQLNHGRGGRVATRGAGERGTGRMARREDEGRVEGGRRGARDRSHGTSGDEGGPGDTPVSIAWLRGGAAGSPPSPALEAARDDTRRREGTPVRTTFPKRGQAEPRAGPDDLSRPSVSLRSPAGSTTHRAADPAAAAYDPAYPDSANTVLTRSDKAAAGASADPRDPLNPSIATTLAKPGVAGAQAGPVARSGASASVDRAASGRVTDPYGPATPDPGNTTATAAPRRGARHGREAPADSYRPPALVDGRAIDPESGVLLAPARRVDAVALRPGHGIRPGGTSDDEGGPGDESVAARRWEEERTRRIKATSVGAVELDPLPPRTTRSTVGMSPWERWLELCARIDGFPRHLSIHTGGMLVTAAPLVDIAPLERATMPNRVVVQYDKRDVETIKLIKLDLLGLRMLSAIDDALRDIAVDCAVHVDLDRLPEDLPDVFRMIQAADTVGVFQIESRAQMQTLPRSRPSTLDDLVVEVAIIRPGPIQGNAVHPYLRRRQGREPVTYLHPSLEPILAETLGVILYQEQVMKIAIDVAGFSPAESDGFRRAMGTWRSTREMEKLHARFVDGCRRENGLTDAQAEELFRQVAAFASFGFNKSHAAAFARTAYESAFLKLYYPAQLVAGLINAQPMGFYPVEVLINDAKRHGVAVLPVDVNRSRYRTTTEWVGMPGTPLPEGCGIERRPRVVRSSACVLPDERTRQQYAAESARGYGIRLGLHLVKGIGEEHAEALDAERELGPYTSLADVVARTGLAEEVVERLVRAGALDSLGVPRRSLLWQLREVAGSTKGRSLHGPAASRPLDLRLPATDAPELPPPTELERLGDSYAILSLDARRQVVELFRPALDRLGALPAGRLVDARPGRVRIGGLVVTRQHPMTARGTVFLALEDETGMVNVTLWPDTWARLRSVVRRHALLYVEGRLEREADVVNVIADEVRALPEIARGAGGPTSPDGVRALGYAGMRRAG